MGERSNFRWINVYAMNENSKLQFVIVETSIKDGDHLEGERGQNSLKFANE